MSDMPAAGDRDATVPSGRPAVDLRLYLVTDTGQCGGPERVAEVCRAAVAGGATLIQVRDPDCDDEVFASIARGVVEAVAGSGVPVLLNDRVHLVAVTGAAGAHIGQSDMAPEAARELLGPDAILGLTIDNLDQVSAASQLPPGTIDYLGVGPVWQQQTKPNAAPPLGLDGVARAVAATTLPCVAIGGIDAERAAQLRTTGIDGVAVVSAICTAADPAAATAAILARFEGAS